MHDLPSDETVDPLGPIGDETRLNTLHRGHEIAFERALTVYLHPIRSTVLHFVEESPPEKSLFVLKHVRLVADVEIGIICLLLRIQRPRGSVTILTMEQTRQSTRLPDRDDGDKLPIEKSNDDRTVGLPIRVTIPKVRPRRPHVIVVSPSAVQIDEDIVCVHIVMLDPSRASGWIRRGYVNRDDVLKTPTKLDRPSDLILHILLLFRQRKEQAFLLLDRLGQSVREPMSCGSIRTATLGLILSSVRLRNSTRSTSRHNGTDMIPRTYSWRDEARGQVRTVVWRAGGVETADEREVEIEQLGVMLGELLDDTLLCLPRDLLPYVSKVLPDDLVHEDVRETERVHVGSVVPDDTRDG